FLHKLSHRLVNEFDYIAVGNVNAKGLAKTRLAKSVHDAAWSSFRNMLQFKAITHGATVAQVSERLTSQTCSSCGNLPDSRPNSIAGLGIREWVCSDCGAMHDRDVNAALNILRRGRATLAVGIPVL
ncbi:transposase, partial [Alcaligenaceae bacterium CGII-47]|nr:transposase [Alcaligenaceae bacterium CGII-47]